MGDFLLVVPADWTQLDWEAAKAASFELTPSYVNNAIATAQMGALEETMKIGNIIPQEATLVAAKLIDDQFFMVQLAF